MGRRQSTDSNIHCAGAEGLAVMRRISDKGRTIIRQQKSLRRRLIPWKVIADMEGVTTRAIHKLAKKL
jgi:hypothetical protein